MDEPDLEIEPLVKAGALPLLLLSGIFHFPSCDLPLRVSEEVRNTIIKNGMDHNRMLAVGCTTEAGALFPVITAATIRSALDFGDGFFEVKLRGIQRMRMVGMNQLKPFPIVRVEPIPYSAVTPKSFDKWQEQLCSFLESRITGWNDSFSQMADWVRRMEDPEMICDIVGSHLVHSQSALRQLLAEESTKRRMKFLFDTLVDEAVG